jgi:hypothetical protein
MTYPPQGSYGQQPDPYGQQQPQYGGGFQQPQYGGGYGQQYGGLGGGPQPPKNNKGPIIAVVSIVVLILAGVGVTGFVAPGFFLSDDKADTNASDSTQTSTSSADDSGGGDAKSFIDKLVTAADDKDKSALEELQCADASQNVKTKTDSISQIDGAELKEITDESDTEAVATLDVTVGGDATEYVVTVVKDSGDWCWQEIELGSGSTDSSSTEETSESSLPRATGETEGEKFVQAFLDKVNAGDGAGAVAMTCPDTSAQDNITTVAGQSAQLKMDPDSTEVEPEYVGSDLIGTIGGQPASGRTSMFTNDAGDFCILTFYASED